MTKQKLYAFWKYDSCVGMIGGEVEKFTDEGRVKVVGFTGYSFLPIKILPGAAGMRAVSDIKRLGQEYDEESEELRKKYRALAADHVGV